MTRLILAFALGAAVGMIVGVILGAVICVMREEREDDDE
jgi:hypothetical protein